MGSRIPPSPILPVSLSPKNYLSAKAVVDIDVARFVPIRTDFLTGHVVGARYAFAILGPFIGWRKTRWAGQCELFRAQSCSVHFFDLRNGMVIDSPFLESGYGCFRIDARERKHKHV